MQYEKLLIVSLVAVFVGACSPTYKARSTGDLAVTKGVYAQQVDIYLHPTNAVCATMPYKTGRRSGDKWTLNAPLEAGSFSINCTSKDGATKKFSVATHIYKDYRETAQTVAVVGGLIGGGLIGAISGAARTADGNPEFKRYPPLIHIVADQGTEQPVDIIAKANERWNTYLKALPQMCDNAGSRHPACDTEFMNQLREADIRLLEGQLTAADAVEASGATASMKPIPGS